MLWLFTCRWAQTTCHHTVILLMPAQAVAKHALGAAADGSIVTAGTQASSSSRPPMPQWPEVYGCRTEKAESCRHRFVAEVTDTMKQPPGGTTSCVPMVRLLGACSRGATGECYSGAQQTA